MINTRKCTQCPTKAGCAYNAMAEIKLSTLAETEKRRQGGDMFVSFGERGVGGKGANRSAHQTCTGRTLTHNDLALSGPTQQSKIAMRERDQHQKMHPVSPQL